MSVDPTSGDNWDFKESERVVGAVDKILESNKPMCDWMTHQLSDHIQSAIQAAHTFIFMGYLRQGVPKEEAKKAADRQVLLVAFDLGLKAGKDIEAGAAFREMWGED